MEHGAGHSMGGPHASSMRSGNCRDSQANSSRFCSGVPNTAPSTSSSDWINGSSMAELAPIEVGTGTFGLIVRTAVSPDMLGRSWPPMLLVCTFPGTMLPLFKVGERLKADPRLEGST